YGGDTNDAASLSPALTQTVTQAATSTNLSSSTNPSTFSQNVVLTATVSRSEASRVGKFKDGSNLLGTSAVSSRTATLGVSTLAAGTHSLTASYGGDTNDAVSGSPGLTQTVTQAATSTNFSSSTNPSSFGQNVVLTATVS